MIFVSAVVPVYNSKLTLERAVNSLLNQREIDEIFLVDDGSTDGSFELAKELEAANPIIRVLHHPDKINKGAPASRNLGLLQAKNKWIQFLDSDDEILPEKIARQLSVVKEDTSIVVSPFYYKKDGARTKLSTHSDIWSGLISTRLGNTTSNLWNGEVLRKVGGWNEKLINVQEYFLMFEIFKVNDNAALLHEPLSKVFFMPESITNSNNRVSEKRDNYFYFRTQIRDFLIQKNKFSPTRFHFYTVCTGSMLHYHKPTFKVEVNYLYFKIYKKSRDFFYAIRRFGLSVIIQPALEFESILF
jgi:glycosyltransferase involved in cell wall biosynthesis